MCSCSHMATGVYSSSKSPQQQFVTTLGKLTRPKYLFLALGCQLRLHDSRAQLASLYYVWCNRRLQNEWTVRTHKYIDTTSDEQCPRNGQCIVMGLHGPAQFRDVGENKFVVKFSSEGDWKHGKNSGRWSLDFHVVLLRDDGRSSPSYLSFTMMAMWLRVLKPTFGMMKEKYCRLIEMRRCGGNNSIRCPGSSALPPVNSKIEKIVEK